MLLPLVTSHRLKSRFYWRRHQALGTMGLRDFGLDVTLKAPPWGQAFIILEGALEAAKEGEQSIVIPINLKTANIIGYPKVFDSGSHIWQQLVYVIGLKLRLAQQKGNTACYWNPSQLSMATAVDVAVIAGVKNRVRHGSPGISSLKKDERRDMSSRSGQLL